MAATERSDSESTAGVVQTPHHSGSAASATRQRGGRQRRSQPGVVHRRATRGRVLLDARRVGVHGDVVLQLSVRTGRLRTGL